MNPDELEIGYILLLALGAKYEEMTAKKIKKRRQRRYKIRPLNRVKFRQGHYTNLIQQMRLIDPQQFAKYTRMSVPMYDHLLNIMEPYLQFTKSKNPISPGERLTITLNYLSQGCSMQEIAWGYYIGITTVHCILIDTCKQLWKILSPIYVAPPTRDQLIEISNGFYKRWNMPNCIGALDGKHVNIQAPSKSGSEYYNYKKNFSINLMTTCDAFYKFTYVDIGAPGSSHDSEVFRNSDFGGAILRSRCDVLDLPAGKSLPGIEQTLPYFFVADQAFPLHERIMRPYPGVNLNDKKKILNYRLSRARRCIENTFGILAGRWRLLRKPIIAKVENVYWFIKATIALHNFLQTEELDLPPSQRQNYSTGYADFRDENGNFHYGHWRQDDTVLQPIGRIGTNNTSRIIKEFREKLANYFISEEGMVNWQQDIIDEGFLPNDC